MKTAVQLLKKTGLFLFGIVLIVWGYKANATNAKAETKQPEKPKAEPEIGSKAEVDEQGDNETEQLEEKPGVIIYQSSTAKKDSVKSNATKEEKKETKKEEVKKDVPKAPKEKEKEEVKKEAPKTVIEKESSEEASGTE